MMMKARYSVIALAALLAAACTQDFPQQTRVGEKDYIGKSVGNFDASEWYPGGELGTTDNVLAGSYEDETPAVTAEAAYITPAT